MDQREPVPSVSLADALGSGADPLRILSYLADLGVVAVSLDDLMRINELADEEELSAHRVEEGIVVTVASQGDWFLFRP